MGERVAEAVGAGYYYTEDIPYSDIFFIGRLLQLLLNIVAVYLTSKLTDRYSTGRFLIRALLFCSVFCGILF